MTNSPPPHLDILVNFNFFFFFTRQRPPPVRVLLKLDESGQHERGAKTQLEGHVVLERGSKVDAFDVSLDPSCGDDVVALERCKL